MSLPTAPTLDAIRSLLSELGIAVREQRQDWFVCALIGDGGSWVGHGESQQAALWNAVGIAFPTEPARALLLHAAESARTDTAQLPPEFVAPPPETVAPLPAPAPAPAPPGPGPRILVQAQLRKAPEPAPLDALDFDIDEDAEAVLLDLVARIEGDHAELATAAPHRQRLVLLGWLASARTWQDSRPDDARVAAIVPDIVRRLRRLTDTWWPGTISAFMLDSWPENCVRDLRNSSADELHSWEAVARRAAFELVELEETESALGFDADGWADAAQLVPAPDDAEERLARLVREIEKYASLSLRQPKDQPVPPPDQLLRWVRQARWLRCATEDSTTWGALMGRLRFWCAGYANTEPRRMLDPGYRPPGSWGSLVRASDDAVALRELLAKIPTEKSGEAQRLAWLSRALPFTTDHHDEITRAAEGLRDWILRLDADRLYASDKRLRRRLRKLQARLDPLAVTVEIEEDDVVEQAERRSTAIDDVRGVTAGKRVLFVSNRADPALQARLVEDFAFGSIDWAEGTPRRIDAAVERITYGAFDMVLGATGFLSHPEDWRLAGACKAVGIPYVRVNKGRPGAVAMALRRDLPAAAA